MMRRPGNARSASEFISMQRTSIIPMTVGIAGVPAANSFPPSAGASGLKSALIVLYKALEACVENTDMILLVV
jgi:hypothetical protein